MSLNFSKKYLLLWIVLVLLFFHSETLALEVSWPTSPAGTKLTDDSTLPELIKYLYEWGISITGIILFLSLILAGFQYLTSVGEPIKLQEAKDRIQSSLLGVIFLLASWIILNLINPALTTFKNVEFNPLESVEGEITLDMEDLQKPCDFAYLYEKPNYEGGKKRIEPGEKVELGGGEEYLSIKSFYRVDQCTQEEINKGDCIKENEEYYKKGGACTVQLYAKKKVGWWIFAKEKACGDKISETQAVHPDFSRISDRQVTCIRLIKHELAEF